MEKLLDIVGFIKIDINDKTRVKYLKASLESYAFLGDRVNKILLIDCQDVELFIELQKQFKDWIFSYYFPGSYGENYIKLLRGTKTNYILNFMEDHFMVCDDVQVIEGIVKEMMFYNVDVLKASFHTIELKSLFNGIHNYLLTAHGYVYINDEERFNQYQKYYKLRYYLGVNSIFSKDFALKFWGQNINSKRPHEYELAGFNLEFIHKVMIPQLEFQCSIDDDHGELGTCLMRGNEPKFLEAREKWKF
jgi:hypothetical protein